MHRYRQNAHTASLTAWSLLCAAAAGVLFVHSGGLIDRPWRAAEIIAGVGLLLVGPAALTIYLLRAEYLWVAVDPERGLLIRGVHLVPWEAIERIERRRPRLRSGSGPARAGTLPAMADPGWVGCLDVGGFAGWGRGALLIAAVAILVAAAALLIWLVFLVFVPLVVVPALEVLAPLGDRITVTASGRRWLFRDLRDADGFVREVAPRVRVEER